MEKLKPILLKQRTLAKFFELVGKKKKEKPKQNPKSKKKGAQDESDDDEDLNLKTEEAEQLVIKV